MTSARKPRCDNISHLFLHAMNTNLLNPKAHDSVILILDTESVERVSLWRICGRVEQPRNSVSGAFFFFSNHPSMSNTFTTSFYQPVLVRYYFASMLTRNAGPASDLLRFVAGA